MNIAHSGRTHPRHAAKPVFPETQMRMPGKAAETGMVQEAQNGIRISGRNAMFGDGTQSIARYLLVRTAAFLALTAASTGILALPYVG